MNPEPLVAPYGSWRSPITAELFASSFLGVHEPAVDAGRVYWKETRPQEGGRSVVVRLGDDGAITTITPKEFNVRTTVHEYGGGDYIVHAGKMYFSNFKDQRLYLQEADSPPISITSPGVDLRYADGVFDAKRNRLVLVREDHRVGGSQAVNTITAIDVPAGGPGEVLVMGNDFYSNPRLSPDNSRLAWLTWNHPNMPWDGTELWVGRLGSGGTVEEKEMVAGGPKSRFSNRNGRRMGRSTSFQTGRDGGTSTEAEMGRSKGSTRRRQSLDSLNGRSGKGHTPSSPRGPSSVATLSEGPDIWAV